MFVLLLLLLLLLLFPSNTNFTLTFDLVCFFLSQVEHLFAKYLAMVQSFRHRNGYQFTVSRTNSITEVSSALEKLLLYSKLRNSQRLSEHLRLNQFLRVYKHEEHIMCLTLRQLKEHVETWRSCVISGHAALIMGLFRFHLPND